MAGTPNNEPCTVHLTWTDSIVNNSTKDASFRAPGWAENLPMENVLKFINWQADRIRSLNQNALVTTGSWSPYASCDAEFFNEDPVNKYAFNHYKVS